MMHVFTHPTGGRIFWVLGMLAAMMTANYMFRLLFVTFYGKYRGTGHPHESPALMTLPLVVLAILSAVGGFIGIPEALGGHHALHHFLQPVLLRSTGAQPQVHHLSHSSEYLLMGVATLIAVIGILIAWTGFRRFDAHEENRGIAKFFEAKWYVDELYDGLIVKPLFRLSAWAERWAEKSGIDGLVNGIGRFVQFGSTKLRLLQNGMVGTYLFLIVIGVVLLFVLQLLVIRFLPSL